MTYEGSRRWEIRALIAHLARDKVGLAAPDRMPGDGRADGIQKAGADRGDWTPAAPATGTPVFPYDDGYEPARSDGGPLDWLYIAAVVLICVAVWVAAVAGWFLLWGSL